MSLVGDHVALHDLFLPMAHNSGTTRYEPAWRQVSLREKVAMPFARPWDQCQRQSGIFELLALGVRVLDLRLALVRERLHLVHSLLCMPFADALSEVRRFLAAFPSETVLVLLSKGHHSLSGPAWSVDWSAVDVAIGASELEAVPSLRGHLQRLGQLRGKCAFVTKRGSDVSSSSGRCVSDVQVRDTWHLTNESHPDRLFAKLTTCCDALCAMRPEADFALLQMQATPSEAQIKAYYLPFLRWRGSLAGSLAGPEDEDLQFRSLGHLHEHTWPKAKLVLSSMRRPVIVGFDNCDENSVAFVISLNQGFFTVAEVVADAANA